MLRSHTPMAPLEEFPDSANSGHSSQNHPDQTQKTDQSANVENLRYCAKSSPFGHHTCPSFPKDLKLLATLHAPLLKNFDRLNSE